MTGYTVHTGSTEKFSQGWDQIFKGKSKAKSSSAKKSPAKATKSASAKKGKPTSKKKS